MNPFAIIRLVCFLLLLDVKVTLSFIFSKGFFLLESESPKKDA